MYKFYVHLKKKETWMWWFTIPATWEVEVGRSWFEVSLGEKLGRLYLKTQTGSGKVLA
jgi:hypothetical protein